MSGRSNGPVLLSEVPLLSSHGVVKAPGSASRADRRKEIAHFAEHQSYVQLHHALPCALRRTVRRPKERKGRTTGNVKRIRTEAKKGTEIHANEIPSFLGASIRIIEEKCICQVSAREKARRSLPRGHGTDLSRQ